MRALLQRVLSVTVTVKDQEIAHIGSGILVLLGVAPEDNESDIEWLCRKISQLRIFNDEQGVMNRSVLEVGAEVLVVSQFTLYASMKRGSRPSYSRAASPEFARLLFDCFATRMSETLGRVVPTGWFGADMQVALVNDGPVTLWLDSKNPE